MPTETKRLNFNFEIDTKSLKEDGSFSGYGSVFDVIDAIKDRVLKGAFLRSLGEHAAKGTMPIMLLNHSSYREIGEWTEVKEDDRGLFVSGRLWIDGPNPDPDALKAYRGMKKQKGKMGLSIGYQVPENGSRYDHKTGINDLIDLDLWEISPVVFPMNDAARIETVKSAKTSIRDFEGFLRESGFSRSEAVAIASKGFKGISSQSESEAQAVELLKEISNIFKTK